ncbi:MAG TPA: hypothetical protein VFC67_14605 [Prolixibacteraceae bacterium]|nr:hypothetical protein [Prolixibacteraceae bacterium]
MFKTITSDLLEKPAWMLFLVTWLFYLIGLFMFSYFVWDLNTYMLSYTGRNFDAWIPGTRRIDMIRYIFSPFWVIGISTVIWFLIKAGLAILDVKFNNRMLFKIIFLGLLLISLPYWVKTIWFILLKGSYTPEDIKNFFPFSFVSFIDTSAMSRVSVKTIAHLNLFHLGFILIVAWLISIHSELKYIKSIGLVSCTYGFGLILVQGFIYLTGR